MNEQAMNFSLRQLSVEADHEDYSAGDLLTLENGGKVHRMEVECRKAMLEMWLWREGDPPLEKTTCEHCHGVAFEDAKSGTKFLATFSLAEEP